MLLGLDLGTTNIKVVLTGFDGRVVARGSSPVTLRYVGDSGVEQDIEEIWSATLAALNQVTKVCDVSGVRALGLSAQGGATQMLDGEGMPRGPVLSWLDRRGDRYRAQFRRELAEDPATRDLGIGSWGCAVGHLLLLRHERPELMRRPFGVGWVGDVIAGRLCGRRAHDVTSAALALPMDASFSVVESAVLSRLGVGEDDLPDLLSPRDIAGGLLPEVAEETSLPVGIPVSAAIHDQYAAALGCGAVHPGDVMFGAGTAWVLLAISDRGAGLCRHVVEGLYGRMASLVNGGSSFAWAVSLLGLEGESSAELDDTLESISPGAEGLTFWPLLAPGGGAGLAPEIAGRLSGLRLSHKAAHVLRSVVEGLACELARYLRFWREAGIATDRLIMCGGAAGGRVLPQLVADATGLPVACCIEPDTSALGAAILARGLVEREAGLGALAQEMNTAAREFQPGSDSPLYSRMVDRYIESLPTV